MKIGVLDGQGGEIGSTGIKKLGEEFGEKVEVIALGARSMATGEKINFEEDLI